jgi:parallel beta-helix repeat protein
MHTKASFFVGLFAFCTGFWCNSIEAATIYVATNGSDNYPGTLEQPVGSIYKASTMMRPGDTMMIRGGTYQEAINNNIPSGISASSPTRVTAYSGEHVTLQPSSAATRVVYFSRGSAYIVLDGLIVDGANVGYDGVKVDMGSHHIKFQNCEIKNAKNQGVLVADSSFIEFLRCSIHDNGVTDFSHGLYLNGADNVVDGCRIYNNAGWGVHAYGSASNRNIVRNNLIYNNARAGNRGPGIGLYTGSGHKAYNNIVWGNREGIGIGEGATNSKVHNNTVYANSRPGIFVDSLSTTAEILNNIVFSNAGGILNQGSATVLRNNLVDVDPKFLSPSSGDFRLQNGSPAIDAGTGSDISDFDFVGTKRPQGTAVDIGAYEIQGTLDTVPPAIPANVRVF